MFKNQIFILIFIAVSEQCNVFFLSHFPLHGTNRKLLTKAVEGPGTLLNEMAYYFMTFHQIGLFSSIFLLCTWFSDI